MQKILVSVPCQLVQCGVTEARPAGVGPLEVRFAHPVRLPPATHSQGKAAEKEIGIERP